MIAKRRSYATLQSYLTPPFLESSVRGIYRDLMEKIKIYNNTTGAKEKQSLAVKALTVKLGIHRELGLDSLPTRPYSEDEVARVENFAEELATEKITGQLYTMGVPYEPERITSSVLAMRTDRLQPLVTRQTTWQSNSRCRKASLSLHPTLSESGPCLSRETDSQPCFGNRRTDLPHCRCQSRRTGKSTRNRDLTQCSERNDGDDDGCRRQKQDRG